jgi:hypothetical protein
MIRIDRSRFELTGAIISDSKNVASKVSAVNMAIIRRILDIPARGVFMFTDLFHLIQSLDHDFKEENGPNDPLIPLSPMCFDCSSEKLHGSDSPPSPRYRICHR